MMGGGSAGSVRLNVDVYGNVRPLERSIRRAAGAFSSLGGQSLRPLGQGLSAATVQASEFTKSIEASNARVLAFGASAGVIYGLVRAMRELVSATVSVEKAMAEINVLVNETVPGLRKLRGELFEVAKATGQSFSEVAEAAKEFARQGLTSAEMMTRVKDAMILTRLSSIDAAESVKVITAALNTFRKEALKSSEVVNKMANVDAAFAVSMGDLSDSISRAGAVAASTGVKFDQLMGMVASAQQQTARGGKVIGNALKTIMIKVERPRMIQYMEDLGIRTRSAANSAKYAKGELLDFQDRLTNLAKAYHGTAGAMNLVDKTGLKLNQTQRSQIDLWAGGLYQVNILKALLQDYASAQGIAAKATQVSAKAQEEAYERLYRLQATLDHAVQGTKATLTELGRVVGELGVDDLLNDVLGSIQKVSTWLSKLVGSSTGWGKSVKAVFKGIGDFLSGPGFAAAVVLIGKFLGYFVVQGAQALASMVGITSAVGKRAALEKQVAGILSAEVGLVASVHKGEISRQAAAATILSTMMQQTAQLHIQRELMATTMGAAHARGFMSPRGGVPRMGMDTVNRNITVTGGAGQGIPNFAMQASMEDILVAARAEASAGYTPMLGYNKSVGGLMVYGKEQGSAQNAVRQHLAAGQTMGEAKRASFKSQKGGKKKVPHLFVAGPMMMGMGMLAMGAGQNMGGGMPTPASELMQQHRLAAIRSRAAAAQQKALSDNMRRQRAEMTRLTGVNTMGGGGVTTRLGSLSSRWAEQRADISSGKHGTAPGTIAKLLRKFDHQVQTQKLQGQYQWLKQTGMLGGGRTGLGGPMPNAQGFKGGGAWTYGREGGPTHTPLNFTSGNMTRLTELREKAHLPRDQRTEMRNLEKELRKQTVIAERALVSQFGNVKASSLAHEQTRKDAARAYNEQQRQTKMWYKPLDDKGKLEKTRFSAAGLGYKAGRMSGVGMIAGPVLGNLIAENISGATRGGQAQKEVAKGAGAAVGYGAMGYMFTSSPWGAAIGAAIGIMGGMTKATDALASSTFGLKGEIDSARLVADALSSAISQASSSHEEYNAALRDSGSSEKTLMRLRGKFTEALAEAVSKVTDPSQIQRLRAASGDWAKMQDEMAQIGKESKQTAIQKQTGLDLNTYKTEQKGGWKKFMDSAAKNIGYWGAEFFDMFAVGSLDFESIQDRSEQEQHDYWKSYSYDGTIYKGDTGRRKLQGDAGRMMDSMQYGGVGGFRRSITGAVPKGTTPEDWDKMIGNDRMNQFLDKDPTSVGYNAQHGYGAFADIFPPEFQTFLKQLDPQDVASFGVAFQEIVRQQEHGKTVARAYAEHVKNVAQIQRKAAEEMSGMAMDLDKAIRQMMMLQSRLKNVFGGQTDILTGRRADERDLKLKTAQMASSVLNPFLSPNQKSRQEMTLKTSSIEVDYVSGMERIMGDYSKDQVNALAKYTEGLSKDIDGYFKAQLKSDAKALDTASIRMQKTALAQNSMLTLTSKISDFLQQGGSPTDVMGKIEEFMKLPANSDLAVHLPAIQSAIYAQTDKMEINLIRLVDATDKAYRLNEANFRFQQETIRTQRNLVGQGGMKSFQKDIYSGAKLIASIVGGPNADLGSGVNGEYKGWDSNMLQGQQLSKMTDLFKNYFGAEGVPKNIKDQLVGARASQMAATAREYNLSVAPSQQLPKEFETGMGNLEKAEDQVANMLQEGIPERLTHIKEEIVNLQTSITDEYAMTQGKMQNAHQDAIRNVLHNGSNTIFKEINHSLLQQALLRNQMDKRAQKGKLDTERAASEIRVHEVGLGLNHQLDKLSSLMRRTNIFGGTDFGLGKGWGGVGVGMRKNSIPQGGSGGGAAKAGFFDPSEAARRQHGYEFSGSPQYQAHKRGGSTMRYAGKWGINPQTNMREIQGAGDTVSDASRSGQEMLFHMLTSLQDKAFDAPSTIGGLEGGMLYPSDEKLENLYLPGQFEDADDDTRDAWRQNYTRGAYDRDPNNSYRPEMREAFRKNYAFDKDDPYWGGGNLDGRQGKPGQGRVSWRNQKRAQQGKMGPLSTPFQNPQSGFVHAEQFEPGDWQEFQSKVDVQAMIRDLMADYRTRLEKRSDKGVAPSEEDALAKERAIMEEMEKSFKQIFDPSTGLNASQNQLDSVQTEYELQEKMIKDNTATIDASLKELQAAFDIATAKLSGDKEDEKAAIKARDDMRAQAKVDVAAATQKMKEDKLRREEDEAMKRYADGQERQRQLEERGRGLGFAKGENEQYGFRTFLQEMMTDKEISKSGAMGLSDQATQMYRYYVSQGVEGKEMEAEMAAAISQSLLEAEEAGYKIEETFAHIQSSLAALRNRLDFKSGRKSGAQYAAGVNQTMQGKVERGTFNVQRDFGELFTSQFARNYKDQMQEMKDLVIDLAATMKSEMKGAFKSWMSGAKSAREALRDMVSGIFEKLLDRGIDAGMDSLFSMTMGPSRAKGGNRVWAKGGLIPKYGKGGKVTGGSGYDDDVLAYMQGGEFVFKKAAAQRMGYENLNRLQEMAEGGKIPAFGRGGQASFTGEHDILFNDPKQPSKMKKVRDPMMSALSMDKESQNPQVQKYYERESKFYDYMNYMHEREQAHQEAMKKFRKQQKNRLIGAAINAALIIAGGAAQSSANASAAAAAGPAPAGPPGTAASAGSQIGQGAGSAAQGITTQLGQTTQQLSQPTGILGKMFGTTLGRTLTFGAAGALTGYLTADEDKESKGDAAMRMGLGGGLAGFVSGMADISMPKWDRERRQRENAKKLADMRQKRGTALSKYQQRSYVGGQPAGGSMGGGTGAAYGGGNLSMGRSMQRRITSGGAIISPGFGTAGGGNLSMGRSMNSGGKTGGGIFGKGGNKRQRLLYEKEWWEGMTLAEGGPIDGAAADVHPAMLMGGEFVLNRDAVENLKKQGQGVAFLNQLNRGGVSPQFAQEGGLVGSDLGRTQSGSAVDNSDLEKLIQITEEVKEAIDHGNKLQEKSPNKTSSTMSENKTVGGGLVNNINISVNVDRNGKSSSNSSSSSQGQGGGEDSGDLSREEAEQFSTMIESKVVEVINREQRPYGLLSKEKYQ